MGLTSWDQPKDPYNYAQLAGNWQIVDFHDHTAGNGVPIPAGGLGSGAVTSQAIAAGVIGLQHLNPAVVQDLGLNGGGSIGRGAISIAGVQTTASSTPTFLTTPDEITGITLDSNGLLFIDYSALWKVSAGTGTGALYANTGSGWVAVGLPAGNNTFTNVSITTAATHYSPLYTGTGQLTTVASSTTDQTSGVSAVVVGTGTIGLQAPAGTWSLGIQFSCSGGGTVSVSNRIFRVRTLNFS